MSDWKVQWGNRAKNAVKKPEGRFKPGEILKVVVEKPPMLVYGGYVTVVDPDRYPKLRAKLITQVGYDEAVGFVLVNPAGSKDVGYFTCLRFRRDKNRGKA